MVECMFVHYQVFHFSAVLFHVLGLGLLVWEMESVSLLPVFSCLGL